MCSTLQAVLIIATVLPPICFMLKLIEVLFVCARMMEQESIQSAFSATGMLMTLLVPVMLLYYLYYRKQRSRLYELADRIQGPPGYPFIGNALEFIGGADSKNAFSNVLKVYQSSLILPNLCRFIYI